MIDRKYLIAAGSIIVASLLACSGSPVIADKGKEDTENYTAMSSEELAEYLIFEKEGFKLDEKTQEGGTVKDRLIQDEIQKACSIKKGEAVDSESSTKVQAIARKSIALPKNGIKLGDWKKGEAVARSGYGYRVGHKDDDHSKREPGGNCYACHQLDPNEIAYGTLGPSLKGFGKARGTSDAMLKYTYEVIYNPHTYFPCTNMPRFGTNGVLTQEQILNVMAYLMHPESPVNQ